MNIQIVIFHLSSFSRRLGLLMLGLVWLRPLEGSLTELPQVRFCLIKLNKLQANHETLWLLLMKNIYKCKIHKLD